MNIIFQTTYNCNLRCQYCYQPKTTAAVLSKNDAIEFLDELFKYITTKESKIFSNIVVDYDSWINEVFTLEFFGGECLLYPQLILDIVDYFKNQCDINNLSNIWQHTNIKLDTNGTLIQTEDCLKLLNKYKDKINCCITFEGTEECHDLKRRTVDGKGTFNIVKSNVEFTQDFFNNKNLINKLTFDNDTVSMLPSVIKALHKMGYLGTQLSYDTTMHLNKEESDNYYKYLCKAIDWIVDNNIRFYIKIFGYRWNNEPRNFNCGSTGGQICISPSGILSSCQMSNISYQEANLPELLYGDLKDGIVNSELINNLRNIENLLDEPENCKACPIKHFCGACPMINYKNTKKLFKIVPNCGASVAEAKAQLYFYQKVKAKPDYPYYQDTIKHIEKTNKYDPNYYYLYLDNYNK